jgi:hypothetical protein
MTASRDRSRRFKGASRIAIMLALVLTAKPALGQQGDPAANGAPRSLLPPPVSVSPASPIEQGNAPALSPPSLSSPGFTRSMPLSGNRLPAMPAPVSVGDLGTVEGPVAGTLGDANGGLGYDMWEGSDRSDVEMILQRLPAALISPTYNALYHQVLLTEATLPVGTSERPFNASRLRKLLDAGQIVDAGALSAVVRSRDPETQRMQADAMLYAGRDIEVCGEATEERLQSADPFWVDLRAYCYHFDSDTLALDLTRSVMEQQGLADPAFLQLLDALDTEEPMPPDAIAEPNAVHIRMLVRLGLPIPANAVAALGMPVSVIAASSMETAPEIRRAAAERAFRAGVLVPETMAEILSFREFTPDELINAATIARGEPMMNALERIEGALGTELGPDERAELVQLAFQIGRNEGFLPQTAALFADDAAAVFPAPDWGVWAPLMIRGLILGERPDAAERWYNILDPLNPAQTAQVRESAIVMALADPTDFHIADAQEPLAFLAYQTLDPVAPPATLSHSALVIGLFEALGRQMPFEAMREVQRLMSLDFAGRRPAPNLMQRIDDASLQERRGELALGILEALGPAGARDLAPDVIVRFVRALRTAGMIETANLLAAEAILTRQGG